MYAHAVISKNHTSLRTDMYEMTDSKLLLEVYHSLVDLIGITDRRPSSRFVVSVYVNGKDSENGWKVADTLELSGGITSDECLTELEKLESLKCTEQSEED